MLGDEQANGIYGLLNIIA